MADEPSSVPPSTPTSRDAVRGRTFKPRAGVQRKSKAERDEYARQEAEKAKARAAQDHTTVSQRTTRVTRGGSRSGRANNMTTRDDRSRAVDAPSGIFGTSGGNKPDRSRKTIGSGISEALDTTQENPEPEKAPTTLGAEPKDMSVSSGRTGGRVLPSRAEEQIVEVESEGENNELVNTDIERIWISSEEDDEDRIVDLKGKQRASSHKSKLGLGLRPVRAPRAVQNDEEEPISGKKSNKLVKSSKPVDDSAIVDVDADDMQVDESAASIRKDPQLSPEVSKKPLRRSSNKAKDPKIAIETTEERAERLRMNEDVKKLKDEFYNPQRSESTAMTDADKGEKLFLFQFPPLVPTLYNPAAPTSTAQNGEADVEPPEVQIKAEPGTDTSKNKSAGSSADMYTAISPVTARLPAGLVGKLKIRKSGKVTLDWGGTDMEVRYGAEVDFLQDAVQVETPLDAPEIDEEGKLREQTGVAYALGQVKRKVVVIPDWSKLYA